MKYLSEEKTMRGQYAVCLVVNNRIKGTLISEWWQSATEIQCGKCYAAAVARRFYRSAGVLVYRAAIDDDGRNVWQLWDSCEARTPDYADSGILQALPPIIEPR